MPLTKNLFVDFPRPLYNLLTPDDIRKTGLFPKQQEKVETDIHERRKDGRAVSTNWAMAHEISL